MRRNRGMQIEIIYGHCFKDSAGEWRVDGLLCNRFTMNFGHNISRDEIENAACAVAESHIGQGKFVVARPLYNAEHFHGFYEWRSFDSEHLTQVNFKHGQ